MLIKHKLEYTALLGDKIEISLQYFEIEQRIIGYCFLFKEHFPVSSFSFVTLMIGVRGGGEGGGGGGGDAPIILPFWPCNPARGF